MGMSAVTFFDGAAGADRFQQAVEAESGLKVTIGSHACTAALRALDPGIRRLAIISPYWPSMNTEVIRYFADMGFEVVRDRALQCRRWTAIAEVTEAQLVTVMKELDGARSENSNSSQPRFKSQNSVEESKTSLSSTREKLQKVCSGLETVKSSLVRRLKEFELLCQTSNEEEEAIQALKDQFETSAEYGRVVSEKKPNSMLRVYCWSTRRGSGRTLSQVRRRKTRCHTKS